jgi:hypothetical protein
MFDLSKQILVLTIVTGMSLFLAACGGDDAFTPGNCAAEDTESVIHSLEVIGVRTDTVNNLEVIDGSGVFTISWDVTSSCFYDYSVYLSFDETLEPIDVEFFSGSCGLGSCDESPDFSCNFDSANKAISCNGGGFVGVGAVIPDPSPQTPYIFLTVSNENDDQSVPVYQQVQVEF